MSMPQLELIGLDLEAEESLLDQPPVRIYKWSICELDDHALKLRTLHMEVRQVQGQGSLSLGSANPEPFANPRFTNVRSATSAFPLFNSE